MPTPPADWFAALVRGADPAEFLLLTSAAGLAAAWLLRLGLRAFWRLRLILDTPTARIRSAAQGYVELQGRAAPWRGRLVAPLSGRDCVWYRYRVEERRGSGRDARWVTLEQGEAPAAFVLSDDSGACLVEPAGAELRLVVHAVWTGATPPIIAGQPPSRRPSSPTRSPWWRSLARLTEPLEAGCGAGWGTGRRYRMTESRIAAGAPVYVLGHLATPRRDQRERDALTRALLTQWKRDPERRRAFDRNGDGAIDLAEWERARQHAAAIAGAAEQRRAAAPVLARVGASGDPRQPFVIATRDEAALAGHQRRVALGATVAGALLGVAVAFAWAVRLAG